MKLLTAPFGFDSYHGVHISLTCIPGTVDKDDFISALEQYSCYPPAINKIISAMNASGRYDCVVQLNWFRTQERNCIECFREIGVKLSILRKFSENSNLKGI